eukprot:3484130-Pyramimonas_sp.AAC.1
MQDVAALVAALVRRPVLLSPAVRQHDVPPADDHPRVLLRDHDAGPVHADGDAAGAQVAEAAWCWLPGALPPPAPSAPIWWPSPPPPRLTTLSAADLPLVGPPPMWWPTLPP